MGIEPTSEAWEASILPLNYARSGVSDFTQKHRQPSTTDSRDQRRPMSQISIAAA
jgi:hypothetical protein